MTKTQWKSFLAVPRKKILEKFACILNNNVLIKIVTRGLGGFKYVV